MQKFPKSENEIYLEEKQANRKIFVFQLLMRGVQKRRCKNMKIFRSFSKVNGAESEAIVSIEGDKGGKSWCKNMIEQRK
jgi:hypothetical protein